MYKRRLFEQSNAPEPFTENELYEKSTNQKTGLDTVTSICRSLRMSDVLLHIKSIGIDYATHSAFTQCNRHPCNCIRSGGVVSIAKHLGECCGNTKVSRWMKNDVTPLIPPSSGQSMQMMTDVGSWPPLTRSYNHLMHAYASAEWRMLAPTRIMPAGAHSVIWHVTTEYLPSIMVRTPQFSLPTTVRQRMTQSRGEIALYGIAAELDSNFMETTEGMIHFMHILEQLAMAGDQCKNLSTALSITQTARSNFHCIGTPDARLPTLYQASKDLQRGFGIVQRNQPNTWQSLIFWHKDKLRYQRGDYMNSEFSFVMPNQITTHVRVLNKSATNYAWAGPAGPAMYGEANHLGLFSIAGMRVFSMQEFTLPQNSFYQPLESYLEFGEYVPMFNDTVPGERYISRNRDRQVFTSNGFQKVDFGWALEHCQIFDVDNKGETPFRKPTNSDNKTASNNIFPWINENGKLTVPHVIGELIWKDGNTEYGVTSQFVDDAVKDIGRLVNSKEFTTEFVTDALSMLESNSITHDSAYVGKATANLQSHYNPIIKQYTDKYDNIKDDDKATVEAKTKAKAAKEDAEAKAKAAETTILTRLLYTAIKCTKENMIILHRLGIRPPIDLILANPHKLVRAMDIVGLVPGAVESVEKAGAVWIADNINEKRQIVVKKSFGNIVLRPQDITCTRAALITAYRGGDTTDPLKPDGYEPVDYRVNGSMVIIAVPVGWGVSAPCVVPEVLYLAKDSSQLQGTYTIESDFVQKYSYPSAEVYEEIFHWVHDQRARPGGRAERIMYGLDPPDVNLACRMATHIKRAADGHFTRWVKGDGYWGMDATYYGAENHRYSDNFGTAEYGTYTLESSN